MTICSCGLIIRPLFEVSCQNYLRFQSQIYDELGIRQVCVTSEVSA